MKITPERIELSRMAIVTYVVKSLVSIYNISSEEALVKFMTAHTYDLLRMDSSKLWSESQEYVLDMLSNEFNNDLTNWLEI
ncbi:hypothetical protein [Clostridium sp. FP1]|uniref:hypothetical protein n=1 Tax=Clostridium sp. FP1 TaxID=2724076 RepID=UPI0013E90D30|nr:hypothetical protein [Clostridium sp. FP1]MBZ9634174.1 hypothetical protein [Clostridium sp. FP1]